MSATTTSSTTPHYNYKTTTATLHCLQPPVAPSVGCLSDSCITTTYFSYRFPICDTSSTALCGTMVVIRLYVYIIIHYFNLHALLIHDASHGFWNVLSKYEMGGSRLNHRRYIYIYIYIYICLYQWPWPSPLHDNCAIQLWINKKTGALSEWCQSP